MELNPGATKKLTTIHAEWDATATRSTRTMVEHRWLLTVMYSCIPVVLAFGLYVKWHRGFLTWHDLTADRMTQIIICAYLFNTVFALSQIYRIWSARSRMQAAKRQHEWEAAHPTPTEGIWPPAPTQR